MLKNHTPQMRLSAGRLAILLIVAALPMAVAFAAAPAEEKTPSRSNAEQDQKPDETLAVRTRTINKSVKDFPEGTDLSTPESAFAAYERAWARRDAKAVCELGWLVAEKRDIDDTQRFMDSDAGKDPAAYRDIMLGTEVVEVLVYRDDLAAVVSKVNVPARAGHSAVANPYRTRSFGRIDGVWKNLGEDAPRSVEAAREDFDRKKEHLWKYLARVRDGVKQGRPLSVRTECGGQPSRSAPIAPGEPLGISVEKADLMGRVEWAFMHGARDVTARKSIEWGDIQKDEKGNRTIRYKFYATIWDKDVYVMNTVFTFDAKGNILSAEDVKGYPQKKVVKPADVSTQKGMQEVQKTHVVDVPIPKDTQGPFGLNMCLSPDGKRIAVAGNITDRNYLWNPRSELFYEELRYPRRVSLRKTFEKNIYVASSSPRLSDYSLLVENHRMSAILAMALSPKEPYQLAYVSREIKYEFPADPKKAIPIPPFTPQSKGFREVLYVVPLSGGAPKVVLTMEARSAQLYNGLYDTSLCWNDDASALFYGDPASVSRISLSGKRDVLYKFEQKIEPKLVENRFLASRIACRPGGIVEFLDFVRDLHLHGNHQVEVDSVWLVTVDQDGKVVQKSKWPRFPFFNPPLKSNRAILGGETWAYLYAGEKESRAHLCVGSRSDPTKIVSYLLDARSGKDRLKYALLGLSPDGSEAWLSQQVDFHDMSDADIERYVPTVPYSSLKRVNLRSIK